MARDTFCIMPFIHLHNMSNGLMKMCCVTEKPILDDSNKSIFVGNAPINEVWNNNFMTDVRKKMLQGEMLPACKDCYEVEDSKGTSLRNEYNKMYKEHFINFVEEARHNDGKIKSFPPFVELRSGNLCNSACRMCNSNDSSLIYKENVQIQKTLKKQNLDSKFKKRAYQIIGNPENVIFGLTDDKMNSRVMDLNKHFDEIITNVKNIKIFTLSGGEPFLLKKTGVILENFVTHNPDVELYINTNGSVLNEKLLSILKKLNRVHVCVSLDGHGLVQEYIRYPLQWDKIEKNIRTMGSLAQEGFYLSFNVTVQVLNILNLDKLLLTLLVDFPENHINLSFLTNPYYFSVQQLPLEIKEYVEKLNLTLAEKIKNIKTQNEYAKINKFQVAERLMELNSYMMAVKTPNPHSFQSFKDNIKLYDFYRDQNIKDYIPDWGGFLRD